MRTVLVTGLGGAGRTTIAAATALAAARGGRRTLLLSPDPGDVLGTPLARTPKECAPGLWAARIDAEVDFRAEFLALQDRGAALFDLLGAARLAEEELTPLPGSEQFALLRAVARAADRSAGGPTDGSAGGPYDVVVVDLPPLAQSVPLLALPEQLRRYLRRLLPPERQAARALRPVLAQLAGVPMPAEWLYETAARWDRELSAVEALINDPGTALRLVAEPGPAANDALGAARPGLALHGLRVETVIANRMLPAHSPDTWLAGLAAQQTKCLDEWHGAWGSGTEVHEVAHAGREVRGLDDLALLDVPHMPEATHLPGALEADIEDRRDEDGILVWSIPLPGASKEGLGLVRRGDELVLTVGPFRRIVPLPSALRRCTVSGAALADGVLTLRFTPDPGLWPAGR